MHTVCILSMAAYILGVRVVSFVVPYADHVGNAGSYRLDLVKEIVPLSVEESDSNISTLPHNLSSTWYICTL